MEYFVFVFPSTSLPMKKVELLYKKIPLINKQIFLSLQIVSNSVQIVFIALVLIRPILITEQLLSQTNPVEEVAPQFLQYQRTLPLAPQFVCSSVLNKPEET